MEHIDTEQARRVWQRVRGGEDGLTELIELEWENFGALDSLSRRASGDRAGAMGRLSRMAKSHWAMLRGIRTVATGHREPPPGKKRASEPLDKIYARAARCRAAYAQRRSDPDFGEVFDTLWQESGEFCRGLLELLGQG